MKSNISVTPKASATPEPDDELWDAEQACAFFGGGDDKPIHISTLYRGIGTGIYPAPMNVSANMVRWLPSECRAARKRQFDQRGNPKPKRGPKPKPRKRNT